MEQWEIEYKREQERERAERIKRIKKTDVYKACGIPPEFWGAKPQDFPKGIVASAIATLTKSKRRSLYLFGLPGRGKTHFSCVMCKHFIEQDILAAPSEVKFSSLGSILLHIRAGFDEKRSEERTLAEYIHRKLLCIDDIGITRASEFSRETFFYIADYRWSNNLSTIYITDQDRDTMRDMIFSVKIMSRIYCNRIWFKGTDRRQTNEEIMEV